MADNFERQKSTRWAKADVPTYGDEWGDEYEDEPEIDQRMTSSESLPPPVDPLSAKPHVSGSTLVLSIDNLRRQSDDEDEDEHEQTPETRRGTVEPLESDTVHPHAAPQPEARHRPNPIQTHSDSVPAATRLDSKASALLPPTPTFSNHQSFPHSPDTTTSEHSFASDADSIQMEPDSLNLFKKNPQPPPAPQEPVPAQTAPSGSSLVYSTSQAPSRTDTGATAFRPETGAAGARNPLILSIDRMNLNDSDNSSFDDEPQQQRSPSPVEKDSPRLREKSTQSPASKQGELSSPGHRIDTEALDSLINDLSQMDGSSLLDYNSSPEEIESKSVRSEAMSEAPEASETRNDSNMDSSRGVRSMLDVLDRSCSNEKASSNDTGSDLDTGSMAEKESITQTFDGDMEKEHQNFMTSMRHASVRKAPTFANEDNIVNASSNSSQTSFSWTQSVNVSRETLQSENPHVESESHTNAAPSSLFASLPSLPPPSIPTGSPALRRESTASNATFNMGNWTPNTSKYRDQFVNDNDTESHMNMSIYNKTDSVYNRFTGTNPGYAESFTNSSCVSVPDTIDNNLHEIREDSSDAESQDPEIMSMVSGPASSANDQHKNRSALSVPSVLQEHPYENGTFQEESNTPVQSADNLSEIKEEESERRVSSSELTDALKQNAPHISSEPVPKPSKQAYPVSDWKKIMTVSQPRDRIELLKKAKVDEEKYDTGLSYWLHEVLKSTEAAPQIQIGQLASQAYQNAQHSDLRRHTSIRSKVSSVRDKMDSGNFGIQATNLGRKFLNRGKKLMKQGE